MIYIENDWSDLEEGLVRALRERDALMAYALAVGRTKAGGGLADRLEALERERCGLQAELARKIPARERQTESDAAARRQARTAQLLVGVFGLLPAGAILAGGLLATLFTAPFELLGLYFTEGRDLGRYMGWPLMAAGLGLAVLVASLLWILLLSQATPPPEDEAGAALRRQANRLSAARVELARVRGQVDALLTSDAQALLPADAPNVDVVALWLKRLGERQAEQRPAESPSSLDDLCQMLGAALPRGVLALRAVTVAPGAPIDLILIGQGRVWLLQACDLPGGWVQVHGAWTRREPGAHTAAIVHERIIDVESLLRAARAVCATLRVPTRRADDPEPIQVRCGIVFTHPDVDLRGYGETLVDYGAVGWWIERLTRDLGSGDGIRWTPARQSFHIADSILVAHARHLGLDRYPATGAASVIFEEQWVAIESWAQAPA